MSSEEEAKKKTRRAARREAQEREAGDERSDREPSSASAGAKKGRRRASSDAAKEGTANIRSEGLRAREAGMAKRRKKRDRERAEAAAEGLDTSELVDDALARGAHATTRFVQKHFKWLQWVVVLSVVGGFVKLIYDYRVELGNQKGSALLMQGVRAEFGTLKSDADLDMGDPGFVDPRPEFDSNEARLKAAAEGYKKAIDGDPEPSRQALAKMGLAGVLFDQGKYKEAEQGYREVRDGQIAASDPQLKGEATEGIALSLEALGQKDAAEKAFKELENLGGGFAKLGQYHRARLLYAAGKRDAAKELLKKLLEKSDKDKAAGPFGETGFVALAARQLLEAIDPTAARPAGGGISPEQLKKIQEQISKAAGIKGGAGADTKELMELVTKSLGEAPPGPAPAPAPVPEALEPNAPPAPAPPKGPVAPA
ncbi:MAG TPA: hypothetical protein VI197_01605, partial [Polyangiaceae bacterium]